MPPAIHILRRLFLLIDVLLNQHGHREEFDHFNHAIQEMDNMLTAMARYDIRRFFRRIVAGDYTLLEQLEDVHGLRQYSNTLRHGNPLQQENIEGRSENDNVMAQETHQREDESHESGRDTQERLRNVASPQRSRSYRSHGDHQQGRYTDLRPKRNRADQEKLLPRPAEVPPQELSFAQPSGPLQPEEPESEPQPEDPEGDPQGPQPNRARTMQCCICRQNIQVIRGSHQVWRMIANSVRELTRQQLQNFVTTVNEYTDGTLEFGMQPDEVTRNLQCWNVNEDPKCVLCLLNYVFQRVGRCDLAQQVRQIRGSLG